MHGASTFCVYETLVETYGKDLANSNRSTPLSESRARNLSSPVFVVRQQYGGHDFFLCHIGFKQNLCGPEQGMQDPHLVAP